MVVVTGLEPRRRKLRITCALARFIPVCAGSRSLRRSSFSPKNSVFQGPLSRRSQVLRQSYKKTHPSDDRCVFLVVVTGLEPVTSRTSNYLTNPKSLDI